MNSLNIQMSFLSRNDYKFKYCPFCGVKLTNKTGTDINSDLYCDNKLCKQFSVEWIK